MKLVSTCFWRGLVSSDGLFTSGEEISLTESKNSVNFFFSVELGTKGRNDGKKKVVAYILMF